MTCVPRASHASTCRFVPHVYVVVSKQQGRGTVHTLRIRCNNASGSSVMHAGVLSSSSRRARVRDPKARCLSRNDSMASSDGKGICGWRLVCSSSCAGFRVAVRRRPGSINVVNMGAAARQRTGFARTRRAQPEALEPAQRGQATARPRTS